MTVREGPVRQFWPPQVYQPATRVAEPLLAIETSDFDQCLQLVGASHGSRRGGHVRRRAGWVLQLRGETLLQIRDRGKASSSSGGSLVRRPM